MKAGDTWKAMRPPLPVSLVTTIDGQGRPNASPKTWWTPVSYDPPLLALSLKPDSDTFRNISETGVFAWHVPSIHDARKVLHTAKPHAHGVNELEEVGLTWSWREHAKLPHPIPIVAHWPWAICWVMTAIQTGDHGLFVGQVGVSGGYDAELGIEHLFLHRGRNEFVALGPEFQVEAYQ